MTTNPTLAPCPFSLCGGEALLVFAATGGAYIECQNCGLTTRVVDDENVDDENAKLVTNLWNTRHTPTPAEGVVERVARAAFDADCPRYAGSFDNWPAALRERYQSIATSALQSSGLDAAIEALTVARGLIADAFDGKVATPQALDAIDDIARTTLANLRGRHE